MRPVPATELELVSGGTVTVTIIPGKVTVIPVVQVNVSALQSNITQINIANIWG
jgi:hypothetical protein